MCGTVRHLACELWFADLFVVTICACFFPPLPATTPPFSTTPPSTATRDILAVPDGLFGTLKAWEFGLIIGTASLIIIAILLSGMVWMAHMTVKRRKVNRRQRRGRQHPRSSTQRPPRSMLEEIQLMDTENVDYGG